MSVLRAYFNSSLDYTSPLKTDYNRVVNYDENGNEYITWEEVDYPSIQASNGFVKDWSLNSLLSAGINPNMPIHTGLNTRLEGIDIVNEASSIADEILFENSNKDSE